MQIVTINGGSSSVKWALFDSNVSPRKSLAGRVTGIGSSWAQFTVNDVASVVVDRTLHAPIQQVAVAELTDLLKGAIPLQDVQGVGHRVVHGGPHFLETRRVTPDLIAELRRISPFDPEHLPAQIHLIESVSKLQPRAQHVACFDTTFHRDLPPVARLLPLPRRYEKLGARRYGFHGLSYTSLLEQLGQRSSPASSRMFGQTTAWSRDTRNFGR